MMRPYGEDLKVYLCREPVDMRKYAAKTIMQRLGMTRIYFLGTSTVRRCA